MRHACYRGSLIRIAGCVPALALLAAAGCDSGIAGTFGRRPLSPFALFGRNDFRPGIAYDDFEKQTRAESSAPLLCERSWGKARRCSVVIEPGRLEVVVDSAGSVIRIVVITSDAVASATDVHRSSIYRDAVRETGASWDSVTPSARVPSSQGAEQRWTAPHGRWIASMFSTTAEEVRSMPDSIAVSDAGAYARFMARRPPPPIPLPPLPRTAPDSVPRTPQQILAAMHSDLRALTAAQEKRVHDIGGYAVALADLNLHLSPGVRVDLLTATTEGWSALATHPWLPGRNCVVFAGVPPSTVRTVHDGRRGREGEVVCDAPPP